MEIRKIKNNKKKYLDLLLLADEQEDMIDRYLERGDMYVFLDPSAVGVCVVSKETPDICELKNIAVSPEYQRKGYGRFMIQYLFEQYRKQYQSMIVGTGDVPSVLSFYESCGFTIYDRIKNFFTDHYDHPIFEKGIQLIDMVYLKKDF